MSSAASPAAQARARAAAVTVAQCMCAGRGECRVCKAFEQYRAWAQATSPTASA